MSAVVLRAYVDAYTDRNKQTATRHVLEYVRDQSDEMKSDQDPAIMYPVQSDSLHTIQRMALAACQMLRAIEKLVSGDTPKLTQGKQDEAARDFLRLTELAPPVVPVDEIEIPRFGPFIDRGETPLEAVNRCICVIMYVSYSLNQKMWGERFGSPKWADEVSFTTDQVPHWMRGQEGKAQQSLAPDQVDGTVINPPKPTLRISVEWDPGAKSPAARALRESLEESGVYDDLGSDDCRGNIDIQPNATAAEVRGLVRSRLNLLRLEAQIKTLLLLPSRLNVVTEAWSIVQNEL